MTAVLLPNGKQHYDTAAGIPLAGGRVFTYDSGTLTPRTTWADAGQIAPNTNPVILDSRGEATIFWSGAYRVIVQDSLGNVVIPAIDGVSDQNYADAQLRTDLATTNNTSKGAGMVGFDPTIAYSGVSVGAFLSSIYRRTAAEIAASVTPTNYQYLPGNINRYGTNSTPGTTDMTAALQAALNVGLSVYVPNGTYLISSACQMKTSSQLIYGDGQLSILLTTTDIETMNSSTSIFGVVVRDINFKNTYTGGAGGPTHFHLHFGTGASGCTALRCGFNTSLTGSVVNTSFHAGVWFEGANLNNILDCTFGMAQILMESTDSTIRGGFVYSFAFQYAIKITSAGEVEINSVRGILGGPDKGCIWIPNASYMNKIVNNYFGGSLTTINIGNGITADQQQMMQIIGNTFHEVDKIGVNLTNPASGCVITGNTFWAGYPKQNDPTFATPGYQDIYIQSTSFGASDVVITGNVCNRFVGPVEDGMPGVGKSNAIEVNSFSGTASNIIRNNTVSGARYYSPSIVDPNIGDSVGDNGGTQVTYSWTPADLSGASLVFTSVNCKYIKDAESVTFWGTLTFPVTASGSGVVIGGLPIAPAAGMEGAVGAVRTNSSAGQKIKLNPAQTYFYITDTVDAQQTNATCSAKYFTFFGRYLY